MVGIKKKKKKKRALYGLRPSMTPVVLIQRVADEWERESEE